MQVESRQVSFLDNMAKCAVPIKPTDVGDRRAGVQRGNGRRIGGFAARHAPSDRGGLYSVGRASWGRGLSSSPGKGRRRGRRLPAIHSQFHISAPQPRPNGTATNRDAPPERTRTRTVFLFSPRAATIASRTSAGVADRLAADFEDDVAFLEAALGSRAAALDLGHDDAFLAGAGDAVGRRNRHAEPSELRAALRTRPRSFVDRGARFALVRQFAERQVDGLFLALLHARSA